MYKSRACSLAVTYRIRGEGKEKVKKCEVFGRSESAYWQADVVRRRLELKNAVEKCKAESNGIKEESDSIRAESFEFRAE